MVSHLFNRANNLRLKCEFDKAESIYEKILENVPEESEAHWGIVLCKYGIEYVEDPQTLDRIPTCHRTLFEAVTADADYLAAIENADPEQKIIYEAEALRIDQIQKDTLAIVADEKPFDVFICYKETDENGKRTVDSTIANEIYYQLTEEGLKVFYAAITLEDKLGTAYEPYIFAALNSARAMLVLGTKPEYFSAVWVKNEWSRYLKLMKTDRKKILIPCYRDMDAYDLPDEFAHLQAQDMAKIGFINDVVRGVRKVVDGKQKDNFRAIAEPVRTQPSASVSTAPLLKRAFMFLEDGEFDRADEFCEQVLNQDPENAEAYLGKLMAELHVCKQDVLRDQAEPFDGRNNYQKAIRFADDKLKSTLTGYIEHINTRNENVRLEGIYSSAKSKMTSAKTEIAYKGAASLFEAVGDYRDSAALASECHEKAEVARKDGVLFNAKSRMIGTVIPNYESAIRLFESISGWKDADEQIYNCKKKIEELKEKAETDRLERERKAEANRLERERKAEIARVEAEKRAKRNKKIAIITTLIVCAVIAFIIVLNTVIIPNGKYNDAVALMNAGKTVEAYEALIALDGYKDSAEKASSIYDEYKIEKKKIAEVGDYIFFGAYEQDNNTSNGKEDIEWLVLDKKDGKVLIISKYALDCQQYSTSYVDVTWETCTLRKWLNHDFINSAFSEAEKAMIPTVTVSADPNPDYSTDPGNATQDKVFLLSITEANKYFSSDSARQCEATAYAESQGVSVYNSNGNCWWWLRSPGGSQNRAASVNTDGYVHQYGNNFYNSDNAVRPVLWIDLNS